MDFQQSTSKNSCIKCSKFCNPYWIIVIMENFSTSIILSFHKSFCTTYIQKIVLRVGNSTDLEDVEKLMRLAKDLKYDDGF